MEVLIALFLLAIASPILLRSPIQYIQQQRQNLEEIHLFLESEKALAKMKEKLLQNELPFSFFETLDSSKEVSRQSIILPFSNSQYIETCSIKKVMVKNSKNEDLWAQISLEIQYKKPNKIKFSKKFVHQITLCQKTV